MKPFNFLREKMTRQAPGESGSADPSPDTGATLADGDVTNDTPDTPDTSFLPEGVLKDGAIDYAALKAHMDNLAPKADVPEEYNFDVPEGFMVDGIPEAIGFDLKDEAFAHVISDAQAILKEIGAPAEAAPKLLGVLAKYEAAQIKKAEAAASAEKSLLGKDADTRMATVARALETALPAELAEALKTSATSANAVRALEKLLGAKTLAAPPQAASAISLDGMTPKQKLELANSQK